MNDKKIDLVVCASLSFNFAVQTKNTKCLNENEWAAIVNLDTLVWWNEMQHTVVIKPDLYLVEDKFSKGQQSLCYWS